MKKFTAVLLASAGVFSLTVSAMAAAPAWTGATSSWFTAANWDTNTVPAAGDSVTVSNSGTAQIDGAQSTAALTSLSITGVSTVDVQAGSSLSATNINVGDGATNGILLLSGSTNVTGAIALSLGRITNRVAGGSIANAVSFSGNFNTIATGVAFTMSGVLSGTGGFTLSGIGPVTLTGVNTYTGPTTISAGTLALSGSGSIASSSAINNAAIFDISGATSGATIKGLSGAGSVKLGANALTFSGNAVSTFSGAISDGGIAGGTGGSVVLAGTSNLLLTGANTYTGGTTMGTGSLLTIGNNTTTGSIVGNIVNNGTVLTFRRSDAYTFAGVISGSGQVSHLGNSVLTLTGANTYTGQTVINPGTLALSGAGGVAGSSLINLSNAASIFDISGTTGGATVKSLSGPGAVKLGSKTLTVSAPDSAILSGVISDGGVAGGTGGSVAITGGTIFFTGASTYTGGTTIASGATLALGQASASGSVIGNIVNNGTLALSHTDNSATIVNAISGTGGVSSLGNNTLTAASTYTGTTVHAINTLFLSGAGAITGTSDLALSGFRAAGFDISGITAAGTSIGSLSSCVLCTGSDTVAMPGSTVTLGAKTLTLTNAFGTFLGVISGTGGLTIAGGTEVLSGTNTYTGATNLSGGTLNVTGSISSSAVTVTSGTLMGNGTVGATTVKSGGNLSPGNGAGAIGTLNVNGNLSLESGAITNADLSTSANDKLLVTGTAAIGGTLNASFASGTYTVGQQFILVTSTGALSGAYSAFNATGLSSNLLSALSYDSRNIFLTVQPGFTASGSTTINSGSTVAVSGNQTSGGLSGNGGTLSISNGTLTANQSINTTFAGVITGNGAIAKTGTGTLILNGASNYTGGTTIVGGVLEIGDAGSPGASILGPVTVGSGGTLMGHGTINGTVGIGAGGTFNPGGSIGTTTVGSATFASGSTFTVETNAAGQSDRINATGAVVIENGATLAVQPEAPLASYGRATTYTVIQAAGGVSGTFSTVTSSTATLLPSVSYSSNAVSLTLLRPDMITAVGNTTNQRNAGAALLAAGTGATSILVALGSQNDAGIQQGFGQLSGEIYASLRSAAIEDSRIIRNTVLDHIGRRSDGTVVWGSAFGGYGSIGTDGNASGLHHDSVGVIAGADMPVRNGFRLGLAGAYVSNNASVAGKTSSATGSSGHVVAYGGWSDDIIDVRVGGDYGWGKAQVTRTVTALAQTSTNSQDQQTGQLFADIGYKFAMPGATVEPYAGIASISATSGAFAENGGSAALSGREKTDTQTYSTLGLRAALAPMQPYDSVGPLTPHIDLGWQHAFKTVLPSQVITFQSLAQSFSVMGAPLASNAAAVRVGFDLAIRPQAILSLDYDGSFASRVQNNAIRGSFAWHF